jgi:phosphate starvation-inducible PhoH-like protein
VRKIKLREGVDLANLFGPQDLHLKMIEGELKVNMAARGDEITLEGLPESVQRAEHILQELADWTRTYHELKPEDISRAIRATEEKRDIPLKPYTFSTNTLSTAKGTVNPKTPTQQAFKPSSNLIWSLPLDLQEQGKRIWPWRWPWPH